MILDTNIIIYACQPGGDWLAPWTAHPDAAIASVTRIEALGFPGISPEEETAILDFIHDARVPRGRVYLDVGTGEGTGTVRDVRRLGRLLVRKGFRRRRSPTPGVYGSRPLAGERRSSSSSSLRYVEDADARHTEAAWAWRLEGALTFLLE